ncbi:uncharacterized protein LOC106997839 [Macaca mulatta]
MENPEEMSEDQWEEGSQPEKQDWSQSFICLCSCHFLTILQLRSTLEIILHKKEATWKTHHCAGSQAEGIFLVLDETFDLDFWVKGTKEENQWQKSHMQARWESGEPQAKSPVLSPLLFKVHDHHDAPLCGYHRNGNLRPYEVVYPNLG